MSATKEPQDPKASSSQSSKGGAVPRAEIREDEISAFDKKAGDSSRSFLIVVLVAAAIALLGIIFFTQAPEGSAPASNAAER